VGDVGNPEFKSEKLTLSEHLISKKSLKINQLQNGIEFATIFFGG
mgnify:CR=1